jgi:tRNA dimethylallyltransferase
VLVLLGPTASGKTALLERLYDGSFEVVVADSMQVYRGLDIGTAKPTPATLARIPHHLVDLLEPNEQYTSGEFVRRADAAMAAIAARGRLPVVSGGTAYYIRALVHGLPETPLADAGVRAALDLEERRSGLAALYKELCSHDPAAAASIHPNDRYRIVRALEILRSTGRPRSAIAVPSQPRREWDFRLVGLATVRENLRARIEARVAGMFDQGLVDEVRGLFRRGIDERAPAMRGIGYREFLSMRRGCRSMAEVRRTIGANTLRFAKRQMTFFRSLPAVSWVDPGEITDVGALLSYRPASRDAAPGGS